MRLSIDIFDSNRDNSSVEEGFPFAPASCLVIYVADIDSKFVLRFSLMNDNWWFFSSQQILLKVIDGPFSLLCSTLGQKGWGDLDTEQRDGVKNWMRTIVCLRNLQRNCTRLVVDATPLIKLLGLWRQCWGETSLWYNPKAYIACAVTPDSLFSWRATGNWKRVRPQIHTQRQRRRHSMPRLRRIGKLVPSEGYYWRPSLERRDLETTRINRSGCFPRYYRLVHKGTVWSYLTLWRIGDGDSFDSTPFDLEQLILIESIFSLRSAHYAE